MNIKQNNFFFKYPICQDIFQINLMKLKLVHADITSDLNFNAFIPNCSGIQVQQHTHVGQKVQTGSFN